MKLFKTLKTQKGFTLIELLIAVTIIGILAAAVSIGYTTHLKNARCSRILQDFDAISKAAETHREVTGTWAGDVDPDPTQPPVTYPAFVPDYMPTWPSGDFMKLMLITIGKVGQLIPHLNLVMESIKQFHSVYHQLCQAAKPIFIVCRMMALLIIIQLMIASG